MFFGPYPGDLGLAYGFCYGMLGISYALHRFLGKYCGLFSNLYYFGWCCSLAGNIFSLGAILWLYFYRVGLKLEPVFGHLFYVLVFIIMPLMIALSLAILVKRPSLIKAITLFVGAAFFISSIVLYLVTATDYIDSPNVRIPFTDLVYANLICLSILWGSTKLFSSNWTEGFRAFAKNIPSQGNGD